MKKKQELNKNKCLKKNSKKLLSNLKRRLKVFLPKNIPYNKILFNKNQVQFKKRLTWHDKLINLRKPFKKKTNKALIVYDSIVNRRTKILRKLKFLKLKFINDKTYKRYGSIFWLKDYKLVKKVLRYKKAVFYLESQGLKRKIFKRRLKPYAIFLIDRQKLKLFYLNMKENQLRNLVKITFGHKDNQLNVFIGLLESRLISFLYRTNVFDHMLYINLYLKKGYVFVNKRKITSANYFLKPGDKITIIKTYWSLDQLDNFENKLSIFFYPSSYMEISLSQKIFLYYKKPSIKDIIYPFNINLVRILNFYKNLGFKRF